ncbi:unnamed protein product, partial [Polarella glacialis]
PWLTITEVQGANSGLFLAKGWQSRSDISQGLNTIYRALRDTGEGFLHCERILALQDICEDTIEAVSEAIQRLAPPLLATGATPTTFAVRNEGGALRSEPGTLSERLAQIAEAVPNCHKADLRQPAVLVQALELWQQKLEAAMLRIDPAWFVDPSTLDASESQQCADAAPGAAVAGSKKASWRRRQAASELQLQALLEASGLLCSRREAALATLEFGAGKGSLTREVRGHLGAGAPCLRWKKADHWSEGDGVHRVRIDIRNLWLPGVSELSGRQVVGIGKHVCGAATDLALRCLCQTRLGGGELKSAEGSPASTSVVGVGIALCCHHVCAWDDYVDQQWILDAGFSAEDFCTIARMSTWSYQPDKRQQELGRACKRFLDAGRVRFLRKNGFRATVQEYVASGVTKENRMLVGVCETCVP